MEERPILKTRTIMNRFKKDGNLTLNLMAESYGMEEAEFLEVVKKVVGKENFTDLLKLNTKRLKAGKGKPVIISDEEDDDMKARVRQDIIKQKERVQGQAMTKSKSETSKEENNTNEVNNLEKLQERLTAVDAIIKSVEGQIDILSIEQEETKQRIADTLQALSELRTEEAEQDVTMQEKFSELEEVMEEKRQLKEKIDKLTVTILIAPGYAGLLSKKRKAVSTCPREGVEVERIPKEEWITGEPTLEKMINSGFDSLGKFMEAYEFVQLVLKYQATDKHYELRCSERIKEMIIAEGGEV